MDTFTDFTSERLNSRFFTVAEFCRQKTAGDADKHLLCVARMQTRINLRHRSEAKVQRVKMRNGKHRDFPTYPEPILQRLFEEVSANWNNRWPKKPRERKTPLRCHPTSGRRPRIFTPNTPERVHGRMTPEEFCKDCLSEGTQLYLCLRHFLPRLKKELHRRAYDSLKEFELDRKGTPIAIQTFDPNDLWEAHDALYGF